MYNTSLPWFLLPNKELDHYKRDSVCLDFETTNLQGGHWSNKDNRIVLACWSKYDKNGALLWRKHKFGDEYEQQELVKDCEEAGYLTAYNAKFELGWLQRCGLDLYSTLVYDPMVAEWVINGNKRVLFSMQATAQRYGLGGKEDLVSTLIKGGVCPSDIPQSWLLKYCNRDVDLCRMIQDKQVQPIADLAAEHIVLARNLVIPVLADIEAAGLELDEQAVKEEDARLEATLARTRAELAEITGGINLDSPKQLGELIYEKLGFKVPLDPRSGKPMQTATGGRPTGEKVLALLKPEGERQERFMALYKEYNKANSLYSKNLRFFARVCKELGGKFYGTINQCRTATHRLASNGIEVIFNDTVLKGKKLVPTVIATAMKVQLQNLPRQYKKLFLAARPGWVVTEFDGAQIEFRTAADLGHDAQAESDIVNGVDIHSFTRDTMNAEYEKQGMDKRIDRQDAKPQTFAPLFGSIGKDAAEAAYSEFFKKKYHGITETQKNWTLTVADRKKLTTPYGLTFYWPDVKIYGSGYVKGTNEIINIPIQGLATGEIIPLSLVFFWHRSKHIPREIFNTVHDSICVRHPQEYLAELTDIAKQAMTHDVYDTLEWLYDYRFQVPLGFGVKSAKNWGAGKEEWKWDVWSNGDERLQVEVDKKQHIVYDTRIGDKLLSSAEVFSKENH